MQGESSANGEVHGGPSSFWLQFMRRTGRAVPVFGSDGSLAKCLLCTSVLFYQKGADSSGGSGSLAVPGKIVPTFLRFPVRFGSCTTLDRRYF